jgi:hypothetical protein
MVTKFQDDGVLSNVLAGLPRVAELIATVPEQKRERALEAAEQSYRKTARELGYGEADAQQWAATVMLRLRGKPGEGDDEKPRGVTADEHA